MSYGTHINWDAGGMSGTVAFGKDENLLVLIYNKPVENPAKSLEAGRRVCENQIYIRIQHPGENANIIDRPLRDEDKRRFAKHWNAFLHNRTQVPEGTPVDLLFPNNPAFAENLRANGIHTVEQLSTLSATGIESIGRGGQECVNRAKKYLDSADKGKNFHLLQKEIEDLKIAMMGKDQQIEKLMLQLKQFMQAQNNPVGASLSPPFVEGYDPQTERINANHVTKELKPPVVIDAIPPEPMFDTSVFP